MTTRLAEYCKERRLERGLTIGQLARLIGYSNLSKGSNRLHGFEKYGGIADDLFAKVVAALQIDPAKVAELTAQDRREERKAWKQWADEPVPMEIVVRAMAGIYCPVPIPKEITTQEAAEKYASEFALKRGVKICLVVSRRLSVWIDEKGRITSRTQASRNGGPNEPYSWVG